MHRREFDRQIHPDAALVLGDAGAIFWRAERLDGLAVFAHPAHVGQRQRVLGPSARALETTATGRIDLENLRDASIRAAWAPVSPLVVHGCALPTVTSPVCAEGRCMRRWRIERG